MARPEFDPDAPITPEPHHPDYDPAWAEPFSPWHTTFPRPEEHHHDH